VARRPDRLWRPNLGSGAVVVGDVTLSPGQVGRLKPVPLGEVGCILSRTNPGIACRPRGPHPPRTSLTSVPVDPPFDPPSKRADPSTHALQPLVSEKRVYPDSKRWGDGRARATCETCVCVREGEKDRERPTERRAKSLRGSPRGPPRSTAGGQRERRAGRRARTGARGRLAPDRPRPRRRRSSPRRLG
jgi:hypothetical protein